VNDFDLAALITAKVSVWGTPRRIAKPPIETVIGTIRTVNVATMTDGGTHVATKTEFRFPLSKPAERSAGFFVSSAPCFLKLSSHNARLLLIG